jgi:hypothetical protein
LFKCQARCNGGDREGDTEDAFQCQPAFCPHARVSASGFGERSRHAAVNTQSQQRRQCLAGRINIIGTALVCFVS